MANTYPPVRAEKPGKDADVHGQAWPATASAQASVLAADWRLFALVGLAVALLVWALILFAALRWRRRDGDALPPQFRRHDALEITWTVLPLVLVCGLFVYTYRAEATVESLDATPDLAVAVNGFRWGWSFAYTGGPVITGDANAPPQLVLPVDKLTRITLTSADVNHAFWVPDFLFKRDAIPGQATQFDLRPTKLGTYLGHCAEFCGLDHARMNFSVRVVAPDEYARWLRAQRIGARP
ncbi:MAG: cytochrome c oxidase subunit II [Candidatus Eremiobacteraeota bacterium]|nr:cytochrome c oxidase subunit II [Candidatus Eremiobacteraeota bacterium]